MSFIFLYLGTLTSVTLWMSLLVSQALGPSMKYLMFAALKSIHGS